LTHNRGELETGYRKESRAGLNERLLLVLKVEGEKAVKKKEYRRY